MIPVIENSSIENVSATCFLSYSHLHKSKQELSFWSHLGWLESVVSLLEWTVYPPHSVELNSQELTLQFRNET